MEPSFGAWIHFKMIVGLELVFKATRFLFFFFCKKRKNVWWQRGLFFFWAVQPEIIGYGCMDELSTQLATILITNIFFTQIVGAFIPWLFSKVTLILGLAKDKKKLDKGVRQKGFFWKWVIFVCFHFRNFSIWEGKIFEWLWQHEFVWRIQQSRFG